MDNKDKFQSILDKDIIFYHLPIICCIHVLESGLIGNSQYSYVLFSVSEHCARKTAAVNCWQDICCRTTL